MPRDKRDTYRKPGTPIRDLLARHSRPGQAPRAGGGPPASEPLREAPAEAAAGEVDEITTDAADEDDRPLEAHVLVRQKKVDRRLDAYLAEHFTRFSRNALQHLIEEELITVNGRATKCSYKLKGGDRVDLLLPPPEPKELKAEPIPLDILYEDPHFIVVNKQSDLIVHPARGHMSGTLLNALVHHFGRERLSNFHEDPTRPGVVHRLDRDTTGVIVVAKEEEAHWRLAVSFERRQVQKEYLAVCEGLIELETDWVDLPIGRHPRVREKMAIRHDGKSAQTRYEVLARYRTPKAWRLADSGLPAGYSVVRLLPHTGRTHQLRVHMAHLGYPMVGDTAYGGRAFALKAESGTAMPGPEAAVPAVFTRQALHAWRLSLAHPISGAAMRFEASPPADLRAVLAALHAMDPTGPTPEAVLAGGSR